MASASKITRSRVPARVTAAQQPKGRVGRNAVERQDVLGELGNKVLHLLAENNLDAVEQLLDDPSSKAQATKAFYHSVMHASNPKLLLWVADQMSKRGLNPNIVTFNCMIGSCMKEQNIKMARRLWDDMLNRGLKPNRITYNIMINAAAKSRNPTVAEEWLARMVQDGIKPCTVSYTAVIDAFAKLGQTDSVEAWFVCMEEAGEAPDAVVFNSVINSCAKAGQLGKAEKWLQRMIQAGFRPDDKTYTCLMHACGRMKDPELAGKWHDKMMSKGFGQDEMAFSALIDSFAKAGRIDRACECLGEMENQGFEPDTMCYNSILHACSLRGDIKTAMHVWFLLSSKGSKGQQPNTVSYNCMIGAFLQAGEPHLAVEWSMRMLQAGIQPDTDTLSMIKDLDPSGRSVESASGLRSSISKLVQAGDFEKAQVCIDHMQRLNFTIGDELTNKIILDCLSVPSSGATSRCTTSTAADFQESQSEALSETSLLSQEASSAQSLMQSLLPNVAVELSAGAVVLSF